MSERRSDWRRRRLLWGAGLLAGALGLAVVAHAAWRDPVLAPGVTQIKAIHIQELRDRVNLLRNPLTANPFCRLPAFLFADDPLTAGTPVKALHIRQLVIATEQLYVSLGAAPVPPLPVHVRSGPGLVVGIRVSVTDINQLRGP